jgi:hypothetical protein
LETKLKKTIFVTTALVFLFFASAAFGQQFDAAFGVSTIKSSSASTANGLLYPSASGGAYPGFSGDLLLYHHIGFEGEVSWRASQALYGGYQPFRPLFYAFNAIYAPKLTKNISVEVLGGVGGEDIRFYGYTSCSSFFGCTTYSSSNHFMGDFGGGIRAYIWHDVFIRPDARLYLVHNNNEFSSGTLGRFGVSLGYSFGGR